MSGTETEAARKWLTMDKDQSSNVLCVDESATASLRALGPVALSLIMVCGRARTGKSFLMNMLMEQPGFFTVRSGQDPTTVGADLSSFKPYSDFAGSAGGCGVGGQVGFVDVEGQGDRGPKNDMMLAAPLLLVSKAVIFNWKGEMARDEMLDKLGVLAEVARRIRADGNAAGHYRIFGHLHVVMRDQASIEGVFVRLFEDEKCSATDAAAVERNTKRRLIRQCFASIRVWDFPAPIELTKDLNAGKFTEADVLPEFTWALQGFKCVLTRQLQLPLARFGRILSAEDIAEFVPLLAAAMNEGQEEFVPQSLFGQMDKRQLEAAVAAAIASFDAWAVRDELWGEGIHARMPMVPPELLRGIETRRGKAIRQLMVHLDRLNIPPSEDKLLYATNKVNAHVDRSKEALVLANEKEIRVKVDAAKAAAFVKMDGLAAAAMDFDQWREPVDTKELEDKLKDYTETIMGRFDAMVGPFDPLECARDEVWEKAEGLWLTIRNHNKYLQEMKRYEERIAAAVQRADEAEAARLRAEQAQSRLNAAATGVSIGGMIVQGIFTLLMLFL